MKRCSSFLLILFSFSILQAQTPSSESVPSKVRNESDQLLKGLLQTGYQYTVGMHDRRGLQLTAGVIFGGRAIYKYTYQLNDARLRNREHSFEIALNVNTVNWMLSLGAGYYKDSRNKDILFPALTFYDLHVANTNFGYNIRLAPSLYALGASGLLYVAPVMQANVTYLIH